MTTTSFTTLDPSNLNAGGILLETSYASIATLPSLVLDNHAQRVKCTLICDSSQNGTWIIYDVNERGGIAQIISITVTGGTLSFYTWNHIARWLYMTFTPAGVTPGTVMLRGYTGGFGIQG